MIKTFQLQIIKRMPSMKGEGKLDAFVEEYNSVKRGTGGSRKREIKFTQEQRQLAMQYVQGQIEPEKLLVDLKRKLPQHNKNFEQVANYWAARILRATV